MPAGCFGPAEAADAVGRVAGDYGSVVFISGTVWYWRRAWPRACAGATLELAAANRRLVAATEERARHMLRTTHQLKAPFAAIHANAQLLLGGYCGPLPDGAGGGRTDCRPLRDVVAGNQGDAATGQSCGPRPRLHPSRRRSICRR